MLLDRHMLYLPNCTPPWLALRPPAVSVDGWHVGPAAYAIDGLQSGRALMHGTSHLDMPGVLHNQASHLEAGGLLDCILQQDVPSAAISPPACTCLRIAARFYYIVHALRCAAGWIHHFSYDACLPDILQHVNVTIASRAVAEQAAAQLQVAMHTAAKEGDKQRTTELTQQAVDLAAAHGDVLQVKDVELTMAVSRWVSVLGYGCGCGVWEWELRRPCHADYEVMRCIGQGIGFDTRFLT